MKILLTGSRGLIGSAFLPAAVKDGYAIVEMDIAAEHSKAYGDIMDAARSRILAEDVDGIIHLAGMSRVVWGEEDPKQCRQLNCTGTENIINAALLSKKKPWIIYASSREVYGNPLSFPVRECAVLNPINVYGRSKYDAEMLIEAARAKGLSVGICRFSNVYGSATDHETRVIPKFICSALSGAPLTVEEGIRTFDFTYVHDVVLGLLKYANLLQKGATLPPVHLVSGTQTSLFQLAKLVISKTASISEIIEKPGRQYDAAHFIGDPTRAKTLLDWTHNTSLSDGIEKLIAACQKH